MKAPKTVIELKSLMKDMIHRERFVFQIDSKTIEVYNAILKDNVNKERNITLTILNGETVLQNKSKMYKLWKDSDFEKLLFVITNV